MKIEYIDNISKGPGFGKIVFSESILPEGPWQISLQRGSDKQYGTGKAGKNWTPEKILIPLAGNIDSNGSLTLFLEPAIVDVLDPQEQYAVILYGSGEPQKGRLHIDSVTYSPSEKRGNLPPEEETRAGQHHPGKNVEEKPLPPLQEPSPTPVNPGTELDLPAPAPRSHHWLRWALILFLIVACLIWFYFDPRKNENSPAYDTPQTSNKQIREPAAGQETEAQVANFFKNNRLNPGKAMVLANKLPKEKPHDQDAVYRLYYFAAENAEPSAYFPYAQTLDPTQPKWGSIEKDGAEAWKFYKLSNAKEASSALLNLEKWLEDQAASGNSQSRQWLSHIHRP